MNVARHSYDTKIEFYSREVYLYYMYLFTEYNGGHNIL